MNDDQVFEIFEAIRTDNLMQVMPVIIKNNYFNYCFPRYIKGLSDYKVLTHKCPVLSVAAYFGSYDVFRFLISNNSDIHLEDENNTNPVGFAIAGDSIKILELLFENGAIDSSTSNYFFLFAAKYNSMKAFTFCTQNLNKLNFKADTTDSLGMMCIHYAALNGNIEMMKFILEHGGDINSATLTDSRTPIMFAAIQKNPEVLKYILSVEGIDPNLQTKFGDTALTLASSVGILENIKLLVNFPQVDVNHSNSNGATSLHNATINNRIEVVKFLISVPSIDINALDTSKMTALHRAALLNLTEIMDILHNTGKVTFENSISLIHIAAEMNNVEYLKKFIEDWKLDVNTINDNNETPLGFAISQNRKEAVEYLLTVPDRKVAKFRKKNIWRSHSLEKIAPDIINVLKVSGQDVLDEYQRQAEELKREADAEQ